MANVTVTWQTPAENSSVTPGATIAVQVYAISDYGMGSPYLDSVVVKHNGTTIGTLSQVHGPDYWDGNVTIPSGVGGTITLVAEGTHTASSSTGTGSRDFDAGVAGAVTGSVANGNHDFGIRDTSLQNYITNTEIKVDNDSWNEKAVANVTLSAAIAAGASTSSSTLKVGFLRNSTTGNARVRAAIGPVTTLAEHNAAAWSTAYVDFDYSGAASWTEFTINAQAMLDELLGAASGPVTEIAFRVEDAGSVAGGWLASKEGVDSDGRPGTSFSTVVAPAGTAPTVDQVVTADQTPTLTGTFDALNTTNLSVTVNSVTYVDGTDAELETYGDLWILDLSSITPLAYGTYDVTVISDGDDDATSGELVILDPDATGTIAAAADDYTVVSTNAGSSWTRNTAQHQADRDDSASTIRHYVGKLTIDVATPAAATINNAGLLIRLDPNLTTDSEVRIRLARAVPADADVDTDSNWTTAYIDRTLPGATNRARTYRLDVETLVEELLGESDDPLTIVALRVEQLTDDGSAYVLADLPQLDIASTIAAPTAPTVNSLTTSDRTPVITGTLAAAETTTLEVTVDGTTYTRGTDPELTSSGNTWTLDLSGLDPQLAEGTYSVTATATNAGGSTSDASSNELVIIDPPPAPTVNSQSTTDTTPVITGTFDASATNTLTALLDGETYTLGTDPELTAVGDDWTLDLSALDPVLDPGTYPVTVTATNGGGSTVDATTNELTIQADLSPTVSLDDPDAIAAVEAGYEVHFTCEVALATGGAAITSVEFFLNGSPLGVGTHLGNNEYSYTYTPPTAASGQTLSVLVTDESDLTANDAATFDVTAANSGPSLSWSAPAADAELPAGQATTLSVSVSDADGIASVMAEAGSQMLSLSDAGGGTWSVSWTPNTLGRIPLEVTAVDNEGRTSTIERAVYVTGQTDEGSGFDTAIAGERGHFVVSTEVRTDNVVQTGDDRLAYARFVDVGPASSRVVDRAVLELDEAPDAGVVIEAIAVNEPASVSNHADFTARDRVSLTLSATTKSIDITDLVRGLAALSGRTATADIVVLLRSTEGDDATVTHAAQRLLLWTESAAAAAAPGDVALWVGQAPAQAWQATLAIDATPRSGWQLGLRLDGRRFYAEALVGETAASVATRLAQALNGQATATGVTASATDHEILLTATDDNRHTIVGDFAVVPQLTVLRPGQPEIPQRQELRLPLTRSGQFDITVTAEGLDAASDALLADATPEQIGQTIADLAEQIEAGDNVTVAAESLGVSLADLDHESIVVDIAGLDTALSITIDTSSLTPNEGTSTITVAHVRAANALHQLACDPDAAGTALLTINDVDVVIAPGDGIDLYDDLVNAGVPQAATALVRGGPGLVLIDWQGTPTGRAVAASVSGQFEPPDSPLTTTLISRGTGPNYLDEPANYAGGIGLAPGRLLVFERAERGPTQGLRQWAIATSDAAGVITADFDYARNQTVNVWADGVTPLPSGLSAGTEYVIRDDDRTDGLFRLETMAGAPVSPAAGTFRVGVKLSGLDLKSTFVGELGRPRLSSDAQWIEDVRYARLAFADDAEVIIGEGSGRGAELIRLDLGDWDGNIELILSGNGAEDGRPAVCLLGDGGATVELHDADVGLAEWPDESATFGTIKQTGGFVHIGRGATFAGGTLKQGGVHLEGTATTTPRIRP